MPRMCRVVEEREPKGSYVAHGTHTTFCGDRVRNRYGMTWAKSENKRENAFFSVPQFCLLLTRLVLRLLLRQ